MTARCKSALLWVLLKAERHLVEGTQSNHSSSQGTRTFALLSEAREAATTAKSTPTKQPTLVVAIVSHHQKHLSHLHILYPSQSRHSNSLPRPSHPSPICRASSHIPHASRRVAWPRRMRGYHKSVDPKPGERMCGKSICGELISLGYLAGNTNTWPLLSQLSPYINLPKVAIQKLSQNYSLSLPSLPNLQAAARWTLT